MPVTDDGVVIWLWSFLACLNKRENVGDVTGGLERTNGGAALEADLGRVGDGWCGSRGSDEAVMASLVGLCQRPQSWGLGRIGGVPRPPEWGLGWSGRMGWFVVMSCWRPNKEEFSMFPFCVLFPLNGVAGWFSILIWVPLIVVPDSWVIA
jgi:hypothetical protein